MKWFTFPAIQKTKCIAPYKEYLFHPKTVVQNKGKGNGKVKLDVRREK